MACLAFRLGQPAPTRDSLIEILWPGSDPEAGLRRLAVELSAVRRQLEPPGIPGGAIVRADRYTISLDPENVTTDVASFENLLRQAQPLAKGDERTQILGEAVRYYGGSLLPEIDSDWIEPERERLASRFLAAAVEAAEALLHQGAVHEADEIALIATQRERLREVPHVLRMRCEIAAGRPEEALRRFDELTRILRESSDESPGAEARRLAAEARRLSGGVTGNAVAAVAPVATERKEVNQEAGKIPTTAPVLPPTLTRFFGREAEIAAITRILGSEDTGDVRLLTLTGMGGAGKTRLSIEAARRLADTRFAGAVWFVPLAETDDLARVPSALRAIVAPMAASTSDIWEVLENVFSKGPSLVVFDNLEHLLDVPVANDTLSISAFLEELLRRFPLLTCLTTTRQRIGIGAEQEFSVPPLPIAPVISAESHRRKESPVGEAETAPEQVLQYAGVALFADRARRARFDFQVTERNAAAITALCARLEGIPLGLELAAAWAKVLTPAGMLAQFDAVKHSRDRGLPARHRSLDAAIEGSYRLLDDDLRRFFRALSVFQGGCTLDAARAVCAMPEQTLSLLSDLCDRSLVIVEEAGESSRYRLLETVRTFAAARLAEDAAENNDSRDRYIAHFAALAAEANDALQGPDQAEWLTRLSAEHQNLSAALEQMDRASRLQTAGWLHRYWLVRGYMTEGRKWLGDVLAEDSDEVPAEVLNKAINVAGVLALQAGDFAAAEPLFVDFADRCHAIGDERGAAAATINLAIVATNLGNYDQARIAYESTLDTWRRLGRMRSLAATLNNLGTLATTQEDIVAARRYFEESLALQQGDDDKLLRAKTLQNLASIVNDQRDYSAAMFYASEALKLLIELSDFDTLTNLMAVFGGIEKNIGNHKEAVRLYGAMAAAAVYMCVDINRQNKNVVNKDIQELKAKMSGHEFDSAWHDGNSLSWQQILTLVISTSR